MARRKNYLIRTGPSIELRAIGHLERPAVLSSRTYRIRPSTIDKNIYITVSDYEVEGEVRPFEVFASSKYTAGYQFLSVLMRLISARLQEPGPFPFYIIDELVDSFDSEGGYFISEDWLRPLSLRASGIVCHIGLVLRHHVRELGLKEEKKE